MAGSPKEKLRAEQVDETETGEQQEVYLPGGKKLVVQQQGDDQLVEIRSESGLVELRVRLTEQGPVLHMESVRLKLTATEAVEIESAKVAITATEQLDLHGGKIEVEGEEEVTVDAKGDVRVRGKTIWLN